eukprot:GFUD01011082.1.p1 GENE.GFUD01011082.1~~GFUD01011082.1.p1  ORF type:complete len:336 (+),score=59.33 GFUD01011082.1:78-1085(+)
MLYNPSNPNPISWAQGMETMMVLGQMSMFLFVGPMSLTTLIYMLLFSEYWWVSVAYATWWLWDVQTCNTGGRQGVLVPWARGWHLWKHYRNYFPIKLVKTAPLDPSRNYIICSHPHGILCFGALCCFSSEGEDFSLKFPGISPKLTTIEGNLWMPAFREVFLSFGAVSSSRTSMNNLLSTPGGGCAPVLMVGGVPEMDNFHRDKIRLILRKRKGFVKMALRHGASLVPTFSFGEIGLFKQADGCVRRVQETVRKTIGIAPVIFFGRGWIQDTFGILPQRKPITVVVGKPIDVEKNENPSDIEIEELHERYVKDLKSLYNEYNPQFGDTNMKLIIK